MFSGEGKKKKRVYLSKYALSILCICSKCGDIYRRVDWNNRGERLVIWRYCTRVECGPKTCYVPTVREEELQEAVVKDMNEVIKNSEETSALLIKSIEKVIAGSNLKEIEVINKETTTKQNKFLAQVREKKDYTEIVDEVDELKNERHDMFVKKALDENKKAHQRYGGVS